MEGSICCHLAAALLYARDKWILIFCLSFELLFVVWWFLLGHIVSVVLPHILVFSFSSKLLCSSGKQLICFWNQELWGGKTPLGSLVKGHATTRNMYVLECRGKGKMILLHRNECKRAYRTFCEHNTSSLDPTSWLFCVARKPWKT